MDAAETVRHWVERLARTRLGFCMDDWNACSGDLLDAADTIERLQMENKLLKKENEKAWLGRQNVINDRQKARKELDAALAEVERLRDLLRSVVAFADEAHAKWDADEDMRVGKMLIALAGGLPRYRPDTDAIHAALKS